MHYFHGSREHRPPWGPHRSSCDDGTYFNLVGNIWYYFWNQASSDPDQLNRLIKGLFYIILLKSGKNVPHGEDNGILPKILLDR